MSKNNKITNNQPTISAKNIDDLVEQMIKEPVYHSRDGSFRLITSRRSPASHVVFEFPGEYVQSLNTDVHTEDGRDLKMDYAEMINPDDKIKIKSNLNVEQQSILPDDDKIDSILYYGVELTHETNLPTIFIIMTHKNPGAVIIFHEIHGHIVPIHYIYVDAEKVSKRLSIFSRPKKTPGFPPNIGEKGFLNIKQE